MLQAKRSHPSREKNINKRLTWEEASLRKHVNIKQRFDLFVQLKMGAQIQMLKLSAISYS